MVQVRFKAKNVRELRQQMVEFLSCPEKEQIKIETNSLLEPKVKIVDQLFRLSIGENLRLTRTKSLASMLSYARKKYGIGLKSKTIQNLVVVTRTA